MKQPKNPPQLNRRLVWQISSIILLFSLISLSAYRAFNRSSQQMTDSIAGLENLRVIQPIPLSGEITADKTEISGMGWYGDYLVLLPQYPHRLGKSRNGRLYAIPKSEILAFLDGTSTDPIEPFTIPIDSQIYRRQIKGFEGFESIAFEGNQAYMTIEASGPMRGYLATGTLDPGLKMLSMDPEVVEIPLQARIENFSDEAIIIYQDRLYTFYETYGINDNPVPVAHIFNLELEPLGTTPAPTIEYRITDASMPDAEGNFWVMNYFFWGDLIKLRPGDDRLSSEEKSLNFVPQPVERLVQLKITESGILPGDHDPIRIALDENGAARNWEALAVLDDRGFLIATDKYPKTILAFVSY